MSRVYHLSFLLDKDGYNRIDLYSNDSLRKLDKYIKDNFHNNQEVRKKFEQDISEFCLLNMKFIQDDNKRNNRNWTGSIAIVCEDNKSLYKIPIMYNGGKELYKKKKSLQILKEKLKDREVIKEIFEKKKFLFSQNEFSYFYKAKDYIYGRPYTSYEKKCFDDLATTIYVRLSHYDDERLYYYLRCLMDYIMIFEDKSKKVNITSVDVKKVSNIKSCVIVQDLTNKDTSKTNELMKYDSIPTHEREGVMVSDSAPEEFKYIFYKALDTGDFDILFNIYSLEEIERYTNLLEGKRK